MTTIHQLSQKYGSDKHIHKYTHIYDERFMDIRRKVDSVVEIGVQNGCSMKMWRDYFINAKIIGLDINTDCIKTISANDMFKVYIEPAHEIGARHTLNSEFPNGIDILIDDGSHHPKEQIETFENLFPLLKSGGIYVIEDIYPAYFGGEFLEYLKKKIDNVYYWDKKSNVGYGFAEDANYWDRNIVSIEIRRMIAFITKGDNANFTC